MHKAIFLDRDGLINEGAAEHQYICSWEDFRFIPGSLEAISELAKLDYKIILITNQRGISRGHLSESTLRDIHGRMVLEIEKVGGRIDAIYFCPHGKGECNCRKPLPGMLDMAARDHNLDLKGCWVIGDSESDIDVGRARDCKTIYVGSEESKADHSVKYLMDAADLVLKNS